MTLPLGEISHRRGPAASAFAARSTLLIDRTAKAIGGWTGRIVVSMVWSTLDLRFVYGLVRATWL
jgi:hypothetical protein